MRPTRPALLLLLAATLGCASAKPKTEDPSVDPDRKFIKLAARRMAVAVYWRGPVADEAYVEQLERRLARRLETVYRAPVISRKVLSPFDQISPDLFLDLVQQGVDDVVIAEFETVERADGPLGAKAYVVALANQAIVHTTSIEQLASKRKGRPKAKRLADILVRKIASGWTDPGAAPKLDPLSAADTLADKGACDHAAKIYEQQLSRKEPTAFTDMGEQIDSERRWKRCIKKIEIRNAIEADRTAKFEVTVQTGGASKTLTAAFGRALSRTSLPKALRNRTDKPVRIVIEPRAIVLELRYHRDRYMKAVKGRDKYVHEQPVVYVDPYMPVIDGILDLKSSAIAEVEPYDRQSIRKMTTTLRLRTLFGDYVDIDFAEVDDRLLLDDAMRVRIGAREEIRVQSAEARVTRSQRYVLGPPRSPAGEITAYGLVFDFFGLGKGKKP